MNYEKELNKLKEELKALRRAIEVDRRELLLNLEAYEAEDEAIERMIDYERGK